MPPRTGLREGVALLAGAVLATTALIGLGAVLGHQRATAGFRRLLDAADSADTLGKLFPSPEQRIAVSEVYLAPAEELARMDEIAWTVPSAPTPFVGYAPAPGRHHNAFVNDLQMRGAALPRVPKPPGAYRIFVTGASVAFGIGAPADDRTIGAYLESILNEPPAANGRHFEVFTFAATGWTTAHERIAIENRLSELEPDLVISYSGVNDMYMNAIGRDTRWLRSYGDQMFWDLLAEVQRVARREPLVDVAANGPPASPIEVARRIEKNVRLAAAALAPVGSDYLFALQPNIAYATKRPTARESGLLAAYRFRDYNRRCHDAIDARLGRMQLDRFRYVDLSGVFADVPPTAGIFIDTGHLGDRGNRIVAERLAAEVRTLSERR